MLLNQHFSKSQKWDHAQALMQMRKSNHYCFDELTQGLPIIVDTQTLGYPQSIR
jgi:hypothetical protein